MEKVLSTYLPDSDLKIKLREEELEARNTSRVPHRIAKLRPYIFCFLDIVRAVFQVILFPPALFDLF